MFIYLFVKKQQKVYQNYLPILKKQQKDYQNHLPIIKKQQKVYQNYLPILKNHRKVYQNYLPILKNHQKVYQNHLPILKNHQKVYRILKLLSPNPQSSQNIQSLHNSSTPKQSISFPQKSTFSKANKFSLHKFPHHHRTNVLYML